jgi:hypothetical protein
MLAGRTGGFLLLHSIINGDEDMPGVAVTGTVMSLTLITLSG